MRIATGVSDVPFAPAITEKTVPFAATKVCVPAYREATVTVLPSLTSFPQQVIQPSMGFPHKPSEGNTGKAATVPLNIPVPLPLVSDGEIQAKSTLAAPAEAVIVCCPA